MRYDLFKIIFILAFSIPEGVYITQSAVNPPAIEQQTQLDTNAIFSPQRFYQYLLLIGVAAPDTVYYQACLETGFFKSDLFLTGNNLFGMKRPYSRETYVIGEYLGHARYNNWVESILDYKIWQDQREIQTDYLQYLKNRHYYEDPYYFWKLKALITMDTIQLHRDGS